MPLGEQRETATILQRSNRESPMSFYSRHNPAAIDPFVTFREEFDRLIEVIMSNRNVDVHVVGGHLIKDANHLYLTGHVVSPPKKRGLTVQELMAMNKNPDGISWDLLPALSEFLQGAVTAGVPATSVAGYAEQSARALGAFHY
jgi:hypothetical protein